MLLVGCGGEERSIGGGLASSAVVTSTIVAPPGRAVTWADVQLLVRGGDGVVLDRIDPDQIGAGLEYLGSRVRILGSDGDAGGDPNPTTSGFGFPPARGAIEAVGGARLGPYDAATSRPIAEVLVGVRAQTPGRYELTGLRVRYRERSVVRTGTLRHRLVLCVVDAEDLRANPHPTC